MEDNKIQKYRDKMKTIIHELEVEKKRLKELYEQEYSRIMKEVDNIKNPQCGLWIKISDVTPKKNQHVLVFCEGVQACAIYRGYFIINNNEVDDKPLDTSKISHWQPLPPNPND